MPKKWNFAPHDQVKVRSLAARLKCSPLLAQILVARGYDTPNSAQTFLNAKLTDLIDPSELPGVPEATTCIVQAVHDNRRITIYGDYDVDGVTSTAILWHCLKLLGATVDYYIPSRLEEGYGLNCDALRQLHEEDPDRLVISVDCGIASIEEGKLAKELGLDLIITDHHNLKEELPPAVCHVHPRLPGTDYPFKDLCGAGVAFKIAWSICQQLGENGKATPRMREFLLMATGLCAVGTIADVVPLLGENRIIVRYGLRSIMDRAPIGLRALMKVAKLEGTLRSDDVAFTIGPRINAAGRLGQARLAVELLTTEDTDRAMQLSDYLDQLNKNRQTVERRIFKQARELVEEHPGGPDSPAFVLSHDDWHPGVIGIVASRVCERFERPAILISTKQADTGQGSGRTYAGFNLYEGIQAASGHLERFGGHKAAAGLRVDPAHIDDFRSAFVDYVGEHHHPTSNDYALKVDAEVRLADVNRNAVLELDVFGPFGAANRQPRLAANNVELVEPPRTMGEGDRHLSIRVRHYNRVMRCIAFGKGEWADEIAAVNGPISICFTPKLSTFQGFERVELRLVDWKPANTATAEVAPHSTAVS
ncbi:MAG: single-stranded-DNA-specific exonuclease RecJ [Planctomycetaceae bacterium]